jgi:ribosomal protein L32
MRRRRHDNERLITMADCKNCGEHLAECQNCGSTVCFDGKVRHENGQIDCTQPVKVAEA